MPQVTVEFLGLAKRKAGVSSLVVDADSIKEMLCRLSEALPEFTDSCTSDGQLNAEYLMSIDGRQFTRDTNFELADGTTVLILSADVGG